MPDDFHSLPEDCILLGKVSKPQGLQGEIKITCYSGQPQNIGDYKKLYFKNSKGEVSKGLSIAATRVQGKTAIVLLEEITSRDTAEELRDASVYVTKSDLPGAVGNSFYYFQFQGKQVNTIDGANIGKVRHLFNNGAQDILVIGDGKEEVLIPVTKNIVIQETEGTLIVDVPPGLLDLNRQS